MISNLSEIIRERIKDKRIIKIRVKTSSSRRRLRICTAEGCNNKHFARGFCNKHYIKFMYHNDPVYREKQLNASKKWARNNREKFNEYHRNYYKKHPNYKKERVSKRMLKKLSIEVDKYPWLKDKDAFVMDGVRLENRMKEIQNKGC